MSHQFLTDRSLAQSTAITPTTLIHIVTTGDTTQNSAGSSYKAELQQLIPIFSGSAGTSGVNGSSGTSGVNGSSGTSGNDGTSGVSGTSGIDGTSGTGGTSGIDGTSGTSGSSGTSGTSGIDGTSGINGTSGIDGTSGSSGTSGIDGTSGVNGTSGTSGISFSGGSGNCITDLYVSNIHSCSPLNINPLDEGNVYFGSTSAVTIDLTNNRVGINTSQPTYRLDVLGSYGRFYNNLDLTGFTTTTITGQTSGITYFAIESTDIGGVSFGVRGKDNTLNPEYGKSGDSFVRSSVVNNGLNIISASGATTEDYIRFYAGQAALGTPTMHIQGSGTTKGYIGINNGNPTYRLDISGTTGRLFYDSDSVFSQYRATTFRVLGSPTGNTEIALVQDDVNGANGLSLIYIGTGTTNASLNRGYGGAGDTAIFATSRANDLNIINTSSTGGTSDNIRFYAGAGGILSANTPDIHIQGSGSTKGYVGIGTATPTEKLDVSGKTKTINFQMTSGATTGYVLTSTDNDGNASWQLPSVSADTNFANTNLTFTGSRDHDTNGNYLSITTDNGGYNEGWIYLDKTGVNQGSWIGYASNYVRSYNTGTEIFSSDGILTNRVEFTSANTTFNTNTVLGVGFNVKTSPDSNSLYVNGTSGYVGVGISSPTAKLHINNTTSGNTFLAEDSTNPDSSPFVIDSSGNVGIGVTGTTFKLDVNGTTIHRDNVLISNSKEIFWSDTSAVWPTSLTNRIRWTLNNDSAEIYAFQPSSNDIDFVFKLADDATTATDNYVFWIDDNTGEANDRYPLEMNGEQFIVNPTRKYAVSPSNSGANRTNFYVLKSGATGVSSSILHANVITNRVGVNTSSPTETLDVNGNTLISSGMSASTVTITNPYVPTGSTDPTGTAGTISWSGNTLYFKNNTEWVRITGQTSW